MDDFEKTYQIPFPLESVYRAWVSSQTVIAPAERMEVEAKVGGRYRLIMPGAMEMNGVFSQVVPNRALTYSWQWDGSDERTQVDVRFSSHAGGTAVRIVHSGFRSEDSHATHASGWDSYVDGFTRHLEGAGG